MAAAAACLAAAAVAPAAATAATWGYEQVTPADGASIDPYAMGVSEDANTVFVSTLGDALEGMPTDGRVGQYYYGLPRGGSPWTVGPVDVAHGAQLIADLPVVSANGSQALLTATGTYNGLFRYRPDGSGGKLNDGLPFHRAVVATPSLDAVALLILGAGAAVHLVGPDGTREVVSLDDTGAAMTPTTLGGASATTNSAFTTNALSTDGSSVIFGSRDARGGDHDGAQDLYRRVTTPGAERTIVVTDATDDAGPDPNADAEYRWASQSHDRILWRTAEPLDAADDTDTALDLYLRVGDQPPLLVSRGEGGTGNAAPPVGDVEWSASSDDGERVYFVSREQLTPDAPADTAFHKLYERDVAAGLTRFVAGPLAAADVNTTGLAVGSLITARGADVSFRGIRVTPSGVILQLDAALAGDADAARDVFRWTRSAGLQLLSQATPGAPPSAVAPATILAPNQSRFAEFDPIKGGRSAAADGSRTFFTTAESLTAADADGGSSDVYAWSAEGLELVSPPGAAPYDSTYVDSSADGTRVYLQTREAVLSGDVDPAAVDTYQAILGGGSPPSSPVPPSSPPGPGAAPGPLPTVPDITGPPSEAPVPPLPPAPIAEPPGSGSGESGAGEPATLAVRARRQIAGHGDAVLRVNPSTAGRLRIAARAKLPGRDRDGWSRIGSVHRSIGKEPSRVRVALNRAASRALEREGHLRVRFTLRLTPSGADRPVTERLTVNLRSGDRR